MSDQDRNALIEELTQSLTEWQGLPGSSYEADHEILRLSLFKLFLQLSETDLLRYIDEHHRVSRRLLRRHDN